MISDKEKLRTCHIRMKLFHCIQDSQQFPISRPQARFSSRTRPTGIRNDMVLTIRLLLFQNGTYRMVAEVGVDGIWAVRVGQGEDGL